MENLAVLESSGKVGSYSIQLAQQLQLEFAALAKITPHAILKKRPPALKTKIALWNCTENGIQ
jgi:hypothetical protein